MKKNLFINYKGISFASDRIKLSDNIVWIYNKGEIVTSYMTHNHKLKFYFKGNSGMYHFKLIEI